MSLDGTPPYGVNTKITEEKKLEESDGGIVSDAEKLLLILGISVLTSFIVKHFDEIKALITSGP